MRFDFLICSERSGSNLITKIFDSHPQVCGPFPSHMIRILALNINNYGDLSVEKNWCVLLEDTVNLLEHGIARWRSHFSAEQLQREIRSHTLDAVIRFVYATEARSNGKQRVFVKENHVYTFLSYLLSHFPESRYVFMVRDPRDMALTWKEAPSAHGAVKAAARQWKEDQGRSLRAYGFLTDLNRITLVKFEDLITEPERTTRRICDFLGLTYSSQMLEFHRRDIVEENAGRMSSWRDLQRPIISSNRGLYRKKLSETEIRLVESVCREEMQFFGYELQFDDTIPLQELERELPAERSGRYENALDEAERELYAAFDSARLRINQRRLWADSATSKTNRRPRPDCGR